MSNSDELFLRLNQKIEHIRENCEICRRCDGIAQPIALTASDRKEIPDDCPSKPLAVARIMIERDIFDP